jgi:hypothetical protein
VSTVPGTMNGSPIHGVYRYAGGGGLALTNLLVLTGAASPLRAAVGLPVAVLLPGALVLRALRLPARTGWHWLLQSVGLSLAGLLAVSVTLSLLPGPALSTLGCLLGLDLLVALLGVAALATRGRGGTGRAPPGRFPHPSRADAAIAAVAVLLGGAATGLAVAGAHRLNSGGGPALTEAALACAAATVVPAALAARRPRCAGAAATALYLLGLAVLLATSLRGTGVTGHDNKIEYRVFTDTLSSGSWAPGGFNVSYNSCLSITVLPAFLARLLGLAPLDVFRVCFQLLFATVPVGVFLLARHVLPPGRALLAASLFVAFPAFVNDMTMLNRQEIAMVFFTVALLTVLDTGAARRRYLLFGVLAAGLTVSHYTSSYVAASIVLLAWLVLRLDDRAGRLARRRRMPAGGAGWSARPGAATARLVTGLGPPAVTLLILPIAWAVLSGDDAIVVNRLHKAASAVLSGAPVSADATAYSLIGGSRRQTDEQLLARYVTDLHTVGIGVSARPAGPGCAVRLLPADILPRTPIGSTLARIGIDPGALNGRLRAAAVVLFQGGAVLGIALLGWQSLATPGLVHLRWGDPQAGGARAPAERSGGDAAGAGPGRPSPAEVIAALGIAALVLLAGMVAAPQLSDDYGLLRLFQQALVVLAGGVVLALVLALHRLCGATTGAVAGALVVGCLLTTSGVVPQLTGGFPPQLNLNNAGGYFRAYYTTAADLRAAQWIDGHLETGRLIIADGRDTANLRGLTRLTPHTALAPGAVPASELVQLTTPDGRSVVATAAVGDRVLRYSFPLRCIAAGRPLLHAEGSHRIYGPAAVR